MKLKAKVATLEEVPEAFRSLYVKGDDGGFELDVEDNVSAGLKAKLKEFRDGNTTLKQQYDEAVANLKKFDGIDPTKYAEAKDALDKIEMQEEAALMKAGKFDVLRQKWTEQVATGLNKKLEGATAAQKAAEEKLNAKAARLNTLLLEQQAVTAFGEVGSIRGGAMVDVMNRVKSSFKMGDDETPVANEGVTDEEGKPLNLVGYGKKLLKEASYLFEGSGGGGAGGGRKQDRTGKVTTISNDPLEFGRNLEGLAKGTTVLAE